MTGSSDGGGGGDAEPGDGAVAQGCAGSALCDDFESDTVGSAPSPDLWTLVGTQGCSGMGNPAAPVLYPIVVDGTQHHSGTKSVKVAAKQDSCGPLMVNTSAFSTLSGTDVYGRFYVLMSDTTTTFDHTAAMVLTLGADAGAILGNLGNQGPYLQLAPEGAGNPTNVFMWQTDDQHILPDKQMSGGAQSVYPQPNTWACVEFHTSKTSNALETWAEVDGGGDGQPVPGLTFVPGTTATVAGVNDQWQRALPTLSPLAPTGIGFGWVAFSGPASMTLWFDDIVLSNHRIHCSG